MTDRTLIVLGEDEREFIDNLVESAYRNVQDKLNIEDDSQVFEIIRESLERVEENY
jgi:hypothetical protein